MTWLDLTGLGRNVFYARLRVRRGAAAASRRRQDPARMRLPTVIAVRQNRGHIQPACNRRPIFKSSGTYFPLRFPPVFGAPSYRFSHSKNSAYQSFEFLGFMTQWFSSGNQISLASIPCAFSVL